MTLTTNQLLEISGDKTCIINNYLKGRLEKDFGLLISKGCIKIDKKSSTSHVLTVFTTDMSIATKRQIFNHSMLKERFKL